MTPAPIRDSFLTSDGMRLHYAVDDYAMPWRKRPTLVLLHAAMGSMNRFHNWLPELLGDWRVVRWDMRGHGHSQRPRPDEALDIHRLTQDLVEMLDHLGLDQVHLAGSSAGGIVALHMAARHPGRLLSLGGYAAIPGLSASTGHNDYNDWTQGLVSEGVAAFLRRTIRQRFHLDQVEPGFIDWFVEDSARNDPSYLARFVKVMAGTDFSELLPTITTQSLFVVPSNDPVHSDENYAVLKVVPNHRYIIYPDMPHNITDALPRKCAAELAGFLRAVEAE
jgi:pimeloyl-ACP methyl ester carboxylesterase